LKYRFEGFETHTRQRQLRPPSDHGPDLFLCAWNELRAVLKADPRRLRLLGLSAQSLGGEAGADQAELFGADRGKLKRLNAAVDAVRERHGEELIKRGNQSLEPGHEPKRRRTGFSPP